MDFSSLGLGELDWVFVVIILLSTLLGASRGYGPRNICPRRLGGGVFCSLYCSADLAAVLPFQAHMGSHDKDICIHCFDCDRMRISGRFSR